MSRTCAHCRLPVPEATVVAADELPFCCAGCRTVHTFLNENGLSRFYDLQPESGLRAPAIPTGAGYGHLDHESLRERMVRADGLFAAELALDGLRCAACVWVVEKLPALDRGIVDARVDLGRHVVRVVWDGGRVSLSRIARLLDSLGYPARLARDGDGVERGRRENRRHLVRIAVAFAIASNVMVLSFALFGGMLSGMAPEFVALFRWTGLALTVLALVGPGREFLHGALAALRTRTAHMDLPIAVALVAGVLWGAANTIRGVGHTYFESLTAVIFLLLVGRYLVFRSRRSAENHVELLFRITPQAARRIEGAAVREVPLEALVPGDRVEVRAGDSVPVDGTVTHGRSRLDMSLLTGESVPRDAGPGERVWAGTQNLGGRIEIVAEATGAETRAGKLMRTVERCSRERAPVVELADRIAHVFVLAVLVLAAATAIVWWRIDPSRAAEQAIALLIVTCPCALGLATPLAVVAAIGQAARRGILVKGGAALEVLAGRTTVFLDKTGTLTQGAARLVAWHGVREIVPFVVAAERGVSHPLARAIVDGLPWDPDRLPEVEVTPVAGRGLLVRGEGRELAIGSPVWIGERLAGLDAETDGTIDALSKECLTPVVVAGAGHVCGVLGIGDPLHADARSTIEALEGRGHSIRILSGDDRRTAVAVARGAGVAEDAVEAGATPERKLEVVREARHEARPVVMVGDGINDAAALAAADVGVAVRGGAEASLAAADVYLSEPGLSPLVDLVDGARRTMTVIRRNLVVSLLYNLAAAALAVTGRIDPLVAAVLMPVSSLTVVTLSYRARTFRPRGGPSTATEPTAGVGLARPSGIGA